MFYHPNDNGFTAIVKHLVFWASLITMFGMFILLFRDDAKIPQKDVIVKLDVKNKVNICQPEDEKIFKKTFFNF